MRDAAATTTAATVPFSIQNNTGSDTVYAFVTGQAIDNGNALMLLEADGQTQYFPASPASTGSPLGADCAIPLNASGGAPVTITVPHLAGARLWFSIGAPITFLLNPGPALVEPSVTNPSDPNIDLAWDFCEFTYNQAQLFANLTFVDFASIPVALSLTDTSGAQQTAAGLARRRPRHHLRRPHRPGRRRRQPVDQPDRHQRRPQPARPQPDQRHRAEPRSSWPATTTTTSARPGPSTRPPP